MCDGREPLHVRFFYWVSVMAKPRQETQETAELVKKTFGYDPETGLLRRLSKVKGRSLNDPVGYAAKNVRSGKTYIMVRMKLKTYVAHRLIWVLVHGTWPAQELDHEDGDGTNNRITNLREATHAQNQKNKRRPAHNSSGHVGVVWIKDDKKWAARVYRGRETLCYGVYHTIEEAIAARKKAEAEHDFHENHGSDRPL
jgi:hypothetical protein